MPPNLKEMPFWHGKTGKQALQNHVRFVEGGTSTVTNIFLEWLKASIYVVSA